MQSTTTNNNKQRIRDRKNFKNRTHVTHQITLDSALAFLLLSLLQYQRAARTSGDIPTTRTIGITVRLRLPSAEASFGDTVVEDSEEELGEGAELLLLLLPPFSMTSRSW